MLRPASAGLRNDKNPSGLTPNAPMTTLAVPRPLPPPRAMGWAMVGHGGHSGPWWAVVGRGGPWRAMVAIVGRDGPWWAVVVAMVGRGGPWWAPSDKIGPCTALHIDGWQTCDTTDTPVY